MLVAATVIALVWANSPWKESYFDLWHTHLSITLGSHSIDLDLQEWVNEALMAIFFFVVGLEIKRELVEGELRDPRKASLPAIAAVGGMLVPALIYIAMNAGGDGIGGWGIPMATDIAMAIGVVSLLGSRVNPSLKLFLLALAIVDDVGAIAVIAIFYSDHIDLQPLAAAGAIVVGLACPPDARGPVRAPARRRRILPVARAPRGRCPRDDRRRHPRADGPDDAGAPTAAHRRGGVARPLHGAGRRRDCDDRSRIGVGRGMARASLAPMDELRDRAAVRARRTPASRLSSEALSDALSSRITLGVVLGLVVGKTIGVAAFSWIAVRMRIGTLPEGTSWHGVFGVAVLAGIGFTVSIFVAGLAFEEEIGLQNEAKIGILAASLIAAGLGSLVLLRREQ